MQLGAIPGNLLAGYLADRFGRKWTNVVLYLLLGVIGSRLRHSVSVVELMIVGFLFVMLANIAIALTIASYIPEMFPTSVRLQGSALANAAGRAGTILSPFMVAALLQAFGIAGVFYSSLVIFAVGRYCHRHHGPGDQEEEPGANRRGIDGRSIATPGRVVMGSRSACCLSIRSSLGVALPALPGAIKRRRPNGL